MSGFISRGAAPTFSGRNNGDDWSIILERFGSGHEGDILSKPFPIEPGVKGPGFLILHTRQLIWSWVIGQVQGYRTDDPADQYLCGRLKAR
jgi:hypothetical protein